MGKHKHKKEHFNRTENGHPTTEYINQTELGKTFGISAIKVGKLLQQLGLREGKEPTQRALEEETAKAFYLPDGTPFYKWERGYTEAILEQKVKRLSKVEFFCDEVRDTIKLADKLYAEGCHKLGDIALDNMYAQVPSDVRPAVRKIMDVEFENFKWSDEQEEKPKEKRKRAA